MEQQQQSVDIPTTTTKRKNKRKAEPSTQKEGTYDTTAPTPNSLEIQRRRNEPCVHPNNKAPLFFLHEKLSIRLARVLRLHLFATPSKRLENEGHNEVSSSSTTALSTSQDYPATPKINDSRLVDFVVSNTRLVWLSTSYKRPLPIVVLLQGRR